MPATAHQSSQSASAVLFQGVRDVTVAPMALHDAGPADVVVDVTWSAVSTGTERLLWAGEMPHFPGLSYPLVPGYEAVGTVTWAGPDSGRSIGAQVFVPGARCHANAASLFGAAASRLVVPGERAVPVPAGLGRDGLLLALAATAHHALGGTTPELIVGHGVLGRLMARILMATGAPAPTVWEREPSRRTGADGYSVVDPSADEAGDYRGIVDASGDAAVLDALIPRMARGSEIVLAGFYDRVSFAFPPAFMREARLRVAAEFTPADLAAVVALIERGALSLGGLVTHTLPVCDAGEAYDTAFSDVGCLKMALDWSR